MQGQVSGPPFTTDFGFEVLMDYQSFPRSFKYQPHEFTHRAETKTNAVGTLSGYASIWYGLDSHGTVTMPGCFADSLPGFLDRNIMGGIDHDHARPVGRWTSAHEDRTGLFVDGRISDTQAGRDLHTLLLDGVVRGLSVGMNIEESEPVTDRKLKEIWKRVGYQPSEYELARLKKKGSATLIHKARLREVSPTGFPSNEKSEVSAVRNDVERAREALKKRLAAKPSPLLAYAFQQREAIQKRNQLKAALERSQARQNLTIQMVASETISPGKLFYGLALLRQRLAKQILSARP